MERIGERLRRRREELGLTLEDVSESIRYRPEVISAIEEGRTSVFPAKAYLSAFLRAYAVILELDPREIVREQKSEEERAFEAIRNIRMKPKRRRRIPRKAIYIVIPIVLAVALLLVVDRFLWDREPGPEVESAEPPVPVAPADTAGAQDTVAVEQRDQRAGEGEEAREEAENAEESTASPPDTREQDVPAQTRPEVSLEDARAAQESATAAAETSVSEPEVDAAREDSASGRGDEAQTSDAPVEIEEPMVPLAEEDTETVAPEEPRLNKLVVSARRGAYISLSTGGRSIHDGYFSGGEVDSFFSETPFVIVALTDRGAWTFVQNGERVRLPGSSSEDVSNFEIPLPSGD
jgi:cytoskeleton protein RodZ